MLEFPILGSNDPLLRTECLPFSFSEGYTLPNGNSLDAHEIFEILKDHMCKYRGIGLSACQLGIMTRMFIMGNPDDKNSIIPIINPNIVNVSDEISYNEEGCISFPGLFIKIKRPNSIRARFANLNGEINTANFSGLSARVFQHEYDHLNGILFTKRASSLNLERARSQQKKLNRLRKKNAQNFNRTI